MLQPIIFLMLFVVSLSQKIFFSLVTSLFPLDPSLCAPQARTLEMWRGVVKGACGPLAGDTPRIGTKRQIGSRNSWENAKRQVWNTILKREAAAMDYTHGRLTCIGCQSFQPSICRIYREYASRQFASCSRISIRMDQACELDPSTLKVEEIIYCQLSGKCTMGICA